MFAQMQTVKVDGRTIRFADEGPPAGPRALVLVHAFPVGTGVFHAQQEAFPGWRVVVPALPGFDGSDLLAGDTVDAYAGQVLALLDELGIHRAVVGGVSLGGYVAFGVLRQAPERLAGLILADTRSAADTEDGRAARRRLLTVIESSGPAGVAAEMVPTLLGPDTLERRTDTAGAVREMIERQTGEGLAAAVRVLLSRPDSTPLLSRIACPTLVVVGERDPLTPPAEMEQMAAAIPGARFVRIAGAGHLANLEQPLAFNQAVAGFLPV